jgi:hypothetical protein
MGEYFFFQKLLTHLDDHVVFFGKVFGCENVFGRGGLNQE